MIWSPCCPGDSQESSPTSQFESILLCLAFFTVQLSHLYMTTGKTIALNICTFISKVMSLLFNMLSRFVIPFLQMSKGLFISWLQSPYTVILDPKKIKSVTVSNFPPSICHDVMGLAFIKRLFSSFLLIVNNNFTYIFVHVKNNFWDIIPRNRVGRLKQYII